MVGLHRTKYAGRQHLSRRAASARSARVRRRRLRPHSRAAARLAERFRSREVAKIYWGLVRDRAPDEANGATRSKVTDESRAGDRPTGGPARGVAHRVLKRMEARPWVRSPDRLRRRSGLSRAGEVMKETGQGASDRLPMTLVDSRPRRADANTHSGVSAQHPLVGARSTGRRRRSARRSSCRDRIIALHARRLTFLHPIRYEPVGVTAPLPPIWGQPAWGEIVAE